jgi:glutamine phosphoribosylpyrophosphate amidotransferase
LSLDGMLSAVGNGNGNYCTSCYTGHYPVSFPRDEATYLQLALKLDKSDRAGLAERDEAAATTAK